MCVSACFVLFGFSSVCNICSTSCSLISLVSIAFTLVQFMKSTSCAASTATTAVAVIVYAYKKMHSVRFGAFTAFVLSLHSNLYIARFGSIGNLLALFFLTMQ